MIFSCLTLFPDQIRDFFSKSITGRALKKGFIELNAVNIRDFSSSDYGKVDDTMYGGGKGMLMECSPVYEAYKSLIKDDKKPYTIYVSPKGRTFNQEIAKEYSKKDHLLIISGHYEGIDDRVIGEICDEEISIGDYILTGGELPALVIFDAVSRMIPGVLPSEEAYENESHMNGTLEAPQYTKPRIWNGIEVPSVYLSGNDALINEHKRISSLVETLNKRPDLFEDLKLSSDDYEKIIEYMMDYHMYQ